MENKRKGTIVEFFQRQQLTMLKQQQDDQDLNICVRCPVCSIELPERRINHHLDFECALDKDCNVTSSITVDNEPKGACGSLINTREQKLNSSPSMKLEREFARCDMVKENQTTSAYFQHDQKGETGVITPPWGEKFCKILSPRQSPSADRRRLSLTDARQENLIKLSPRTSQDATTRLNIYNDFIPEQKQTPVNEGTDTYIIGITKHTKRTLQQKSSEERIKEFPKVVVEPVSPVTEQSQSQQSPSRNSSWLTARRTSFTKSNFANSPSPKSRLTLHKNKFSTPSNTESHETNDAAIKSLQEKDWTDCGLLVQSSPWKSSTAIYDGMPQNMAVTQLENKRSTLSALQKSSSPKTSSMTPNCKRARLLITPRKSSSKPAQSKRKLSYSTPTKSPVREKLFTYIGSTSPSTSSGSKIKIQNLLQSPRKRRFIQKIPKCFQDLKDSLQSPTKNAMKNLKFEGSPYKLMLDNPDEMIEIPNFNEAENFVSNNEIGQLCYYMNNFLDILQAVLDVPDDLDLFSAEDLMIVRRFYMLSEQGQELFIRLIARKFNWIKKSNIKYPEIADDLQPVLDELLNAGFVEREGNLADLETMLVLLPANSLKTLRQSLNLKTTSGKKGSISQILTHCANQPTISEMIGSSSSIRTLVFEKAKQLLGPCYRLQDEVRRVFFRIMMVYSLTDTMNEDTQKDDAPVQLTTLLMINMGRWIFPPYRTLRKAKIFRSRADLLEYEKAFLLEANIAVAVEAKDWNSVAGLCDTAQKHYDELLTKDIKNHDISLPKFLRRFTAGHILTRCLNQRVEVLQKLHRYEEANDQLQKLLEQRVYCQSYRGHWIERLALNLDQHLKKPLMALEVITNALTEEKLTTNHNFSLYQRGRRIVFAKQNKEKLKEYLKEIPVVNLTDPSECHIEGTIIPKSIPGCRTLFSYKEISESGNDSDIVICSVEEMALRHYRLQGYPNGIHGEGAALVSLFGLLFWDVIYCPGVPDAFRSSHQSYPLDLISQEFYENRKTAIDERIKLLNTLSTEELADRVGQSWRSHERQTSLVSWDLYGSYHNAQSLVTCIGNECLAQICKCFAKNYRHLRSGIPDLTVWNPVTKEWKMVEVKGPGDRLSVKQRVWLDFLNSIGAKVEVCYIKGSKAVKKAVANVTVLQPEVSQTIQEMELPVHED